MSQRLHAVQLVRAGLSVSAAARECGVSRQCLHKWVKRYAACGEAGLAGRSRAPKAHRHAVSRQMVQRVLRLRRRYREGPRALREYLLRLDLDERVPAASTIGRILKDKGLVAERRSRRRQPARPSTLTDARESNDVWCIDFKGEFDVGGRLCYPLTLTDQYSRFCVGVFAQTATDFKTSKSNVWRAFRRYGLPAVIRSDNGAPFVSATAPAGALCPAQTTSVLTRRSR